MKNFRIIFLITVITGHAVIFAQESVYEKECNKIDEFIYSGDFEGGIDYLKQKIAVYDGLETPPDSNYSFYKQEIGNLYYYMGELKLAEKAIIESINFDKEFHGDKSENYLTGLNNLLTLYREMGLYEKSLSIGKQISSLYSQIEIKDSIAYAIFLNNYGLLYYSIGNLLSAEKYYNKAKKINDKLLSENHPDKTTLLNNFGALYNAKGQYARSEKLYCKMLEIDKANFGENHIYIAQDLNNLGVLYTTIGNFNLAEKQLTLARNIYEYNNNKRLGYVYTLNNLALIYLLRNEFTKAELLCKNALNITDTLVSKSNKINTSILSRLSNIYYYKKEYKRVIATLSESQGILKSINPNHYKLVSKLYMMGQAYYALKEYDSAEIQFKEALRIAGFNYEKNHKNYVKSLNFFAEVLYKKNKKIEAKSLFIESMELFIQNIFENFDFLSAREKQKYLTLLKHNNSRFNSFATDYYNQDKKIAGEMFDYNLFLKGLILTSSKKVKEYGLNNISKDDLKKTYDEWINTKEYLAKVYTLSKSEIEKRKINKDSVENIANSLEKKLTRESAFFAKHYDKKRHSWQEIKSMLGQDEAFVQIIRFPKSDSVIYVALIISNKETEHPQMIVLNDGESLEKEHFENYITNINNGYKSNELYNDTGSFINYWKKIENLVTGKKTIYFLPDGIYNKINIAALMMAKKKFVYEIHDIVLLTSVNDYTEQKEVIDPKNNIAVLIGAPDFFRNRQNDTILAVNNTVNSNTFFNYSSLRSEELTPLPLSGNEVRYVDSILSEFNWKTQLYTAENATEDIVKTLRSPKILHISTHGFFTDLISDLENSQNKLLLENDFTSTTINPLFCSGLYLAGAQNSLNGNYIIDDFSEDGILTAYEVTNLNLDSTKLVVLSACETGLGDILHGEGVFGLQRAFSIAGAENIIMSLWKVDDRATQLFMKKFYTFWLSGNTKSEAFNKTINFLRFNTKDYVHPFYWGGFVLLGKEQPQNKKIGVLIFVIPLIVLIVLVLMILSSVQKAKKHVIMRQKIPKKGRKKFR
ncbi:MAG: CHAT domain-containing protein [Bacteroidetes bacterium]|nr:CHAT domain-containing protein [Bacteroidota bacterium]MBL7102895.1 CHAT domain-containing protein [Bacteroidales bacterium]